jgi:hypothetical protein
VQTLGRNLVNTNGVGKKFNAKVVNRRTLLLVIVCLGLAILGVYGWIGYRESVTDRSLFTGRPCAPPCWQGIIPGGTSAEEALQILQSSPYVKRKSIETTGSYGLGAIWAYWKASSGGVVIGLQDGLVHDISLNTPYRLTLGEVVEEFGEPEALVLYQAGLSEHFRWGLTIYYPAKGIAFSTGTTGPFRDPSIKPSMQVGGVRFVSSQSSLKGLLAELYAPYEEDYLEHSRRWRGYGRMFEIYYGSEEDALWFG